MTDRHQTYLYRKHVVNDELIKQAGLKGKSHSLPKTFLTKKGPLLLFSEDSIIETDFFPIHNERTVQIESSIKTTKNLRIMPSFYLKYIDILEAVLIIQ